MILSKWMDDTIKKSLTTSISAETKLFLNYLLRQTKAFEEKTNYDIEHCVPKEVIKTYFHKNNIVVPMSSPCNLVYIPSSDNRSKGELTYYQKQETSPGTYYLNEEQLDRLCYPSKAELQFIASTAKLTEENYFSFLKNRKSVILTKFMSTAYEE